MPGSPVVKTSPSSVVGGGRGAGSTPGLGAKIPHDSLPKKHKTEEIV